MVHQQNVCRRLQMAVMGGVVLVLGLSCAEAPADLQWYRGNIHSHTNYSDGKASLSDIARWYRDNGYDFLSITDHNVMVPLDKVNFPTGKEQGFILVPGMEITETFHANVLNVTSPVAVRSEKAIAERLQNYQRDTAARGGVLIVNHPNYSWALRADDLVGLEGVRLMEVWNCHPLVRNEGDAAHPSTEAMWDDLLTRGMVIYGLASDDTHAAMGDNRADAASPGKGWVMVRARELSATGIMNALMNGDFYASTGVILDTVELEPERLSIAIDQKATEAVLAGGSVFGWPAVGAAKEGFRIEVIGSGGTLLTSHEGLALSYVPTGKGYVRMRALLVRALGGKLMEFGAWTQPVFLQ